MLELEKAKAKEKRQKRNHTTPHSTALLADQDGCGHVRPNAMHSNTCLTCTSNRSPSQPKHQHIAFFFIHSQCAQSTSIIITTTNSISSLIFNSTHVNLHATPWPNVHT